MVSIEFFTSRGFNVSRETLSKLQKYVGHVIETQTHINLIGESTLEDIWERHVLDSAQLQKYLPKEKSCIVDLGSGAGFPGIVLALMTDHHVICVESIQKKAVFLTQVKESLGLNIQIQNDRAEELPSLKGDVVVARALAPLIKLIPLAKRHIGDHGYMLFPKGEKYKEEIKKSRQKWLFECEEYESITNEKSRILRISNITFKR